jgi:hypothetical protein
VRRLAQLGRWLPPVVDRVIGNKTFTADVYPLGLARCLLHLRTVKRFFADADAGTLPAVSIVDPDFGSFSEENPQDIPRGESFAPRDVQRLLLVGAGVVDRPDVVVIEADQADRLAEVVDEHGVADLQVVEVRDGYERHG